MKDEAVVEDRLRNAYRAIAEHTEVLDIDIGALEPLDEDVTLVPATGAPRRGWRHPAKRRLVAAAAAAVVVVGGLAVVVLRHDGGPHRPGPVQAGSEADRPRPLLPGAPIPARYGHTAVWTGHEMIVFGGYDDPDGRAGDPFADVEVDGAAAYDPAGRSWRELADPPSEIKGRSIAVWTGHEIIAFRPNTELITPGSDRKLDAAVYDADADEWHAFETPRLGFMDDAAAVVWTGDRVLIAGLSPTGPSTLTADQVGTVTFDPATGQWDELPDAPVPLTFEGHAVWTGDELVYVGPDLAPTSNRVDAPAPTALAAIAFDPATATWRRLPEPPLSVRSSAIVAWTGDELIVAGGFRNTLGGSERYLDAASFSPGASTWTPLPDAPAPLFRADVVDGKLVVYERDDEVPRPLVLDPASRTWSVLTDEPQPDVEVHVAVSTGHALLFWGGPMRQTGVASDEGYELTLPGD